MLGALPLNLWWSSWHRSGPTYPTDTTTLYFWLDNSSWLLGDDPYTCYISTQRKEISVPHMQVHPSLLTDSNKLGSVLPTKELTIHKITIPKQTTSLTSVQAGAVLMPLAMFLLSLKSIRVLSIMNFILKLAYLYKVTEKKRLIYMHLL